eukprot:CAMPEP_0179304920 /NCGR_PEP_ID=MMETSP0797-20121207/49353_1 /TAXON_ID=47934 /ORGANISM="Dinophysis acuminata, Strain DAEP01" /LENGTH=363 /DNA_ID=CAMNT_0021014545 /DNA_START=69 /DNA_END=1160 /DNA_ORIENTATION=+
MALTQVTPVVPIEAPAAAGEPRSVLDVSAETRVNLTRPPDRENELIKVAAMHGAPGILAVMRARKEYGWFVTLCLRAIEICVSPRQTKTNASIPVLQECDPVAFSIQMLELEMIDEVFQVMSHFQHLREVQRAGLAIIEVLIMDDPTWRDEVVRKGGVVLLCDIARQRRDSPNMMCQVMICMSYLAAEDYIEVMLCQHEALDHVAHILRHHVKNAELVTRASLALLNLTVCEPHVEELYEMDAVLPVLHVLDAHASDVHLVIILCGVLANFSVNDGVRQQLVKEGALPRILAAMRVDPGNAVLQVAGLKALVNYSTNAEHYMVMESLGIPSYVGQVIVDHARDPGVQKYGNYFLGEHSNCPIL